MNSVRIIGGEWRRRILRFPDAEGLRPTPDRVRETLFNWLGQRLTGLSCLDLFAGTGALGFEAASRGAARVVMVERSAPVLAALQENARLLDNAGRLELIGADAVKFATRALPENQRFDVVFLDPPYRKNWIERITPYLPSLLSAGGQLYVEAEYPLASCGEWETVRSGRAGQVYFHLMQRGTADDAE